MTAGAYLNNLIELFGPTNMRAYKRQFQNKPSDITEQYFKPAELEAIKNAIKERQRDIADAGTYMPDGSSPYFIDYNYFRRGNPEFYNKPDSFEDGILGNIYNSFTSPTYNATSTLGRAYYNIDKNGNVTINDKYDFNKGIDLENSNMGYKALHFLGTNAGQPYNIKLNLGNINTWR